MLAAEINSHFHFLQGGGEMGELTRHYDWGETPLGNPGQWQYGLRTTIGIILHSKFPMFLFYGVDLICFYNDAYRPSLGNDGKHPSALGKPAVAVFPEIWNDIKPIIDNVLAGGEATLHEDVLLPIFRNGKLEDVYGTFCYSAMFNDDGSIGGVLVVCQETKPQLLRQLQESEERLRSIIEQAPIAIGLLRGKDMVVEMVNQPILDAWGKDESIVGLPLLEILPELTEQPFMDLLYHVYETGEPSYANPMSAKFEKSGKTRTEYFNFIYTPMRDVTGNITGVMVLASVVTDQVLSQQALERSEARFRDLIKAAPIAIGLFVGRDFIIEEPNQTFIDIVGKGDSIIGNPLVVAMPEILTEGQPFLQILDDVYTSGVMFQTFGMQVKIVQHGKLTSNYYDFTYTPLFDEKGEVYAILDIAVDVTNQVLAQQVVQKNEENLRNVILQAPVGMCILRGPNYTLEIANEMMYEIWGTTREHMLGKPIFDALPSVVGIGLEEILNQVYTTGKAYHGYEVPITLPRTGKVETVYVNFVYEAFKQPDGTISGILAVAIDVTPQVVACHTLENARIETLLAAKELQYTTDRLQLAIEVGELGMYEVDLATDIIIASPRFNEIFQVDDSNVRAKYIAIVHPDDIHIRTKAYITAKETGILDYTVRLLIKDNHIVWIRVKGKFGYDENSHPIKLLGVVQDITESKELEFQKDSFLGIASHELKTPVTSIKAYVQLLEKVFSKNGEEKYAEMMTRVNKQVNRLNYLISDLLDVTKINSGKLQFNITSFDFNQLVAEAIEDIQRISNKHVIKHELRFEGLILADRDRINQVITNLVNNAIKYSPNADYIKISTYQADGQALMCVQDFGIGIKPDKKDRVFEQFYRVSGTKEHTFPGLGLGLYISSEIVKRMGGRIWVNSVEGKGSTFCFSFPIKK